MTLLFACMRVPCAVRLALLASIALPASMFIAGCTSGLKKSDPLPTVTITSVVVNCSPKSIHTNQTSACTSTVTGTGTYSSSVTWSVSPAAAGTVSTSGLFTPVGTGTATIKATSTQDSTKSGSAAVTITLAVAILPASEWTWLSGSDSKPMSMKGPAGVYGTLGVAAQGNVPGGRANSVSWTDTLGNLWLFGGVGFYPNGSGGQLNDLWKYDVTNAEWTWMSGSNTASANGVYGTQGVAAVGNVPGGRSGSVSWTDNSGKFWLFGGDDGVLPQSSLLNDLWEFDPATNEWTWVSGSSTPNAVGVYGTQGVPSTANTPGARSGASSWTDLSGNLWLFGGSQNDDLWEFDPAAKTWTWVNGSSTTYSYGSYGTMGVASSTDFPSERDSAVSWTDLSGNFWLYGGKTDFTREEIFTVSDLWNFNPSSKQWTWVGGENPFYGGGDAPIVYGLEGVAAPSTTPGGRFGSVSWVDATGNLWLYGGGVIPTVQVGGTLNDLWEFIPQTGNWVWVSGAGTTGIDPTYGSPDVPSAQNTPGARMSAVSWVDKNGNFWLLGGTAPAGPGAYGYLNDLWEYNLTSR